MTRCRHMWLAGQLQVASVGVGPAASLVSVPSENRASIAPSSVSLMSGTWPGPRSRCDRFTNPALEICVKPAGVSASRSARTMRAQLRIFCASQPANSPGVMVADFRPRIQQLTRHLAVIGGVGIGIEGSQPEYQRALAGQG